MNDEDLPLPITNDHLKVPSRVQARLELPNSDEAWMGFFSCLRLESSRELGLAAGAASGKCDVVRHIYFLQYFDC